MKLKFYEQVALPAAIAAISKQHPPSLGIPLSYKGFKERLFRAASMFRGASDAFVRAAFVEYTKQVKKFPQFKPVKGSTAWQEEEERKRAAKEGRPMWRKK